MLVKVVTGDNYVNSHLTEIQPFAAMNIKIEKYKDYVYGRC